MKAMEEVACRDARGIGYEWTGRSYQERLSGSQAPLLYALSILFVFLCLAALYESWSVPFSGDAGGASGHPGGAGRQPRWAGRPTTCTSRSGLLTTVGLAAKNAILIVEFAKSLQPAGHGRDRGHAEGVRASACGPS